VTITERFAAVVARYPERSALTSASGAISYTALERAARGVAARLRAIGVGAEDVVGIHLDRSPECVAAMLGALYADAAYLILPPDQPPARLRAIVADARPAAILSGDDGGDHALSARVLPVGDPFGEAPAEVTAREPRARGDSLAYVVYTSGSTGAPKGVGVTHDNLVTLVTDQKYVEFGPDEVFLQLAPLHFDASAFEIWGALLNGSRLVIPRASYAAIDELPTLLADEAVTVLLLTPPLFHEMVRSHVREIASVRRLIVGGEAMAIDAVTAYQRASRDHGGSLANVYGPTEATTLATFWDVVDAPAQIPIGAAIRGAEVYLLDNQLEPVPRGEIGEIYLGGRCVTRGYIGRAGLTSRVFVPDPFNGTGSRMYRSGDIGRRASDDSIEFLGRRDRQVKIRGHRVELGEPEAVLRRNAEVSDAVVMAHHTEAGAQQLVAFVVAPAGAAELVADLRRACADELPAYMRPADIVPIERIPLTSSGKTDHDALIALLRDRQQAVVPDAPTVADGALKVLADLWQGVLGVEQVSAEDDFFALGGDSLLAIRVAAEASAAGLPLALTDLFSTPTLGELAALLDAALDEQRGTPGGGRHRICALLQEQWAALLGTPVEADDDFFAIGGDSLLAIRAVADAQAAGLGLTLELLFQCSDAASLSERLDGAAPPERVTSAAPETTHCAATALQLGFLYEEAALGIPGLYIDVVSRRIRGRLDNDLLLEAIRLTASRHPALRTRFDLTSFGFPAQVTSAFAAPPLRLEATTSADVAQARDIATCRAPFDTESDDSLLRLVVTPLDGERFQLTYGFHHAIMDGWSETVFASDLLGAYDALLRGTTPHLPRLGTTPADFAALEAAAVESVDTRTFWKSELEHLAVPPLPRAARPQPAYEVRLADLSPPQVRFLRETANRERVSMKSVAVAVHLAALADLQSSTRPVTGLVVNGRPDVAGGDELIGLFLNILPFTTDCDRPWQAMVRDVFDRERAMVPHRRFPYADLRALMPRPVEVNCNYVNFYRAAAVDELTAVAVESRSSVAFNSFPLTVDLVQPAPDALTIGVTCDLRSVDPGFADKVIQAHLRSVERLTRNSVERAVPHA
jgi:amino acid adenylation domain-containing protein